MGFNPTDKDPLPHYRTPSPLPTPHERELLTIMQEECLEIIEAAIRIGIRASKLQRFGAYETQPGQDDSNRRRLGLEIGDLYCMVNKTLKAGVISVADIVDGEARKEAQLARFMQTKPEDTDG